MGMGTEKCLGVAKLWTACPQSLVQVEAAGEVWIGWGWCREREGTLLGQQRPISGVSSLHARSNIPWHGVDVLSQRMDSILILQLQLLIIIPTDHYITLTLHYDRFVGCCSHRD